MNQLPEILKKNKYRKVSFTILKTQHLLFKASINGIKGNFILDTGASNSCVDFKVAQKFNLNTQNSKIKASGAGTNNIDTHVSNTNSLAIGRWKIPNFNLIIFDMFHINEGLKQQKVKGVDGIIGADILIQGEAIIDYSSGFLYLKVVK